ncbi:10702_t:CDS:1 [Dentiscutata erythropus]|uniref:10702_t:CDS:1 n=1 Tax=Dentiscutata erythropus TaxID=1348616 RepID=A0A9N9K2W0_9GLOM|nr:10702_t:CDS:1 [Dentiscutata erythropus]
MPKTNKHTRQFQQAATTKWKNKSVTNTTSNKNHEPIVLNSINKNWPTVSSLLNKALDSSVNDDNSKLLSLDAQLKTKTVNINLNTTRQFLHLVNQGYTKMKASELLAKSLGKGPWHARRIHTWANQWKNNKELIKSKRGQHIKTKSLIHNINFRRQIKSIFGKN